MPLFRRHDGDLVRNPPPMRQIMPFLMRRRNESFVFQESVYRAGATLDWVRRYNATHPVHVTIFHVLAYACGQALLARPEMNRFVSGGRLYQRRGVQVSFVVKREMSDSGTPTTVKVEMRPAEAFDAFVERLAGLVASARGPDRTVDRETALLVALPGPLLRGLVAFARLLDAWNLFPRFMTRDDPMYASLFLANLGSAGISDVFHHLYEYGTVSIFGAMSAVRPTPCVEAGQLVVRDTLAIRWTFDERVQDAFYAARSLQLVQQVIEDPTDYLGAPEGAPVLDWRTRTLATPAVA
jgi:hypothetical protein